MLSVVRAHDRDDRLFTGADCYPACTLPVPCLHPACLQVAQTAFVLSERYQCCTEAITATLIAGLLLLLPHLLLVMWAVDRLGLYTTQEAA